MREALATIGLDKKSRTQYAEDMNMVLSDSAL